jgi:phosphate transport system substrate-binding protein
MSDQNASSPSASPDTIVRKGGSGKAGLYAVVAVVVVVALVVGIGYSAGWFKASSGGASSTGCTLPASTPLSGAGSTLVAPLMFTWAAAYSQSTVSYSSIGSGGGITDITQKTVDFGASDAPLNPTQRGAISAPGVVTIPESAGAAVPIYNLPSVSKTLNFTGQVLAAIYLGDITTWNDPAIQALNPGTTLPTDSIVVVHRSDGSGTTFVWTSYLSSQNKTWKDTIGYATSVSWPTGTGAKGNAGVTTTVKSTVDAIGYVDINYALTNAVSFGAVQNPAGNNIIASISNIASAIADSHVVLPNGSGDWYNVSVLNAPGATDYPISTFTYLFVYKDLGWAYGSSYTLTKAENLVDFLGWVVTQGQAASAGLYYVPLSSDVVTADQATIHTLTYNNATIPECVPTTTVT